MPTSWIEDRQRCQWGESVGNGHFMPFRPQGGGQWTVASLATPSTTQSLATTCDQYPEGSRSLFMSRARWACSLWPVVEHIPNQMPQVWREPDSATFSAPTALSLTWKIPPCPQVTGSSQNADTLKTMYGVISRSVCKACMKQTCLGPQTSTSYLITHMKMFQRANRRPLWPQAWSLQSFEC